MLLPRLDCQTRALPNRNTSCNGCDVGDCGKHQNGYHPYKLKNMVQQLNVRTRPQPHHPVIILHTRVEKKGVRRLKAEKKEGPESGPYFGAACGFVHKRGAQKRHPFFRKSTTNIKCSVSDGMVAMERFSAQLTSSREVGIAGEPG
jgi:hypothetical protein